MADNKEILAWATELGQQALTEARGGNATTLNRLSANSSLKLFVDNVLGTRFVSAEQFVAYYPAQWKEIGRLYEDYQREEQVVEAVDKVAALEAKIDKLESMLNQLLEAQTAPASTPAKGKKTQPVVEAETEEAEEAPAEDASESEA